MRTVILSAILSIPSALSLSKGHLSSHGAVLGCSLQACKPCTCSASRPRKEPGVSDREISGLMDRGNLTPLKQDPGATPHGVWQMAGRKGSSLCPLGGGGDYQL